MKFFQIIVILLFVPIVATAQTEEEQIFTILNQWKQAFESQNIDALMQFYSEDFISEDPEATNKKEMRELMQQIKKSGMMSGVEINLSIAKLEISGMAAKLYLYNDEGEKDMSFVLTKENGKSWLITGTPYEVCTYETYKEAYGDDCIEFDGYFRCWDILIPPKAKEKVPLVIDLHGLDENPSGQRSISGFEALAEQEGFIVVWPYGLCKSWNSGALCCPPASEDGIDDVGFIRKMVDKLKENYLIDPTRVYVTGLSNGCSMTQRLANEASDLIAAAACMSLQLLVPEASDYTPVSVMTIMGTNDGMYHESETPGALKNFDRWKAMNNCKGEYKPTWSEGKSVAWTYTDCANNTEVALVTIDKGGHILYPGEDTEINTTQLAWDFMKRFTK